MFSSVSFGQCDQGLVKAIAKKGSIDYNQYGVGILFQFKPDLPKTINILIPQHVVAGADKVLFLCGKKEYPITKLVGSVLSDIAVGEIQNINKNDPELQPQFRFWEISKPEHLNLISIQNQILKFSALDGNKDEFVRRDVHFVSPTISGHTINTKVSSLTIKNLDVDSPLAGDFGSIITSTGAIPGMSGSGLYANNKLIGIVSKTLFGDSLSAVIPLDEIVSFISESFEVLAKNEAKEGVNHPSSFEFTLASIGTYENELGQIGVSIAESSHTDQRHFKIKFKHLEFSDRCVQPSYVNTSNWEPQGSGGGWGEGGSSNKNYIQLSGIDNTTQKNVSLVLNSKVHCNANNEGIEISDGRILLALRKKDGSLFEVHSNEDLFAALRLYQSHFIEYINTNGIFKTNLLMNTICQSKSFGLNVDKCVQDEQLFQLDHQKSLEPNTLLKAFTLNTCTVGQFSSNLSCNEPENEMHFNHSGLLSPNSQFDFDLHFKTDSINGFLRLGQCSIQLKDWPTSLWATHISNDSFEVILEKGSNFNGHGYFLLTPLRIEKKCEIDSNFKGAQWIIQN